jgi:hypothetical protein
MGRDVKGSNCSSISCIIPVFVLDRLQKAMKIFIQGVQSPGQGWNPVPPEYEGMLKCFVYVVLLTAKCEPYNVKHQTSH